MEALKQKIRKLELELATLYQREQARHVDRQMHHVVTETAKDAIIMMDHDGKISFWNKASQEIFGYSNNEALGKELHLLIAPRRYHEAYRKGIEGFRKTGTGPAVGKTMELHALSKDGRAFPIELSLNAIEHKNSWHAVGIVRDISTRKKIEQELRRYRGNLEKMVQDRTRALQHINAHLKKQNEELTEVEEALRQSEEKYRSLFEDSRDAIYIITRDGTFLDVNPAAEEIFGYSREELIGMNVLTLYVNPEERPCFQEEIEKKGSVRDYELQFQKKDGTEITCQVMSTVRKDASGTILGYQGIIRNITEKLRMEKELLKIEKLESIGVLAGGIAHDFNNILTAVIGNIALAHAYNPKNSKSLARLQAAKEASLRARDLTRQLLTFSKGGMPVTAPISITDILHDSVRFVLGDSDIRSRVAIADNLWTIEADETQIRPVIINLLINAQQAMPEGGTIMVTADNYTMEPESALSLRPGPYVKINISDQGSGIPKEHISKIFDPYFSTRQFGNGLGLAITYSVIKNHQGFVDVKSAPGEGTTFSLYLPASEHSLLNRGSTPGIAPAIKAKVLVMDDEELVRDVAQNMLELLGCETEFAGDGKEAIQKYKKSLAANQSYDLVIMDLTIPGGMGGKSAVKKLLKIDAQAKVAVCSGYADDSIMSNYTEYGFCSVIMKPYDLRELENVLHLALSM